jgi:hypothetical protein
MILGDSMSWRKQGDPATPGHSRRAARAKTRAPHDPTYGRETDMLDQPGMLVEPDVRMKIAKYFKKMKLREMIEQILDEMT